MKEKEVRKAVPRIQPGVASLFIIIAESFLLFP